MAPTSSQTTPWSPKTPENQWYGFGRYYAMFPPMFASEAIRAFTRPGQMVLDPFCGRGNGPFTAAVLGRHTVGIDINPLAWLYTAVKLQPERDQKRLIQRLHQVRAATLPDDSEAQSEFEKLAWAPQVRSLLRSARRELDWKQSLTDRTLAAFITIHMQDKLGDGLSNQLPNVVACSPNYAVTWWKKNGRQSPPSMDPVSVLTKKIRRRYRYGIPCLTPGRAILDDAPAALAEMPHTKADLLLTSPPYLRVTDYWNDHWIRLWLLGYPLEPNYRKGTKFENAEEYLKLLTTTFGNASAHLTRGSAILVRCDKRLRTAELCYQALRAVWPNRRLYFRSSAAAHNGVSVFHGRGGSQAREIDYLFPAQRASRFWLSRHFSPVNRKRAA